MSATSQGTSDPSRSADGRGSTFCFDQINEPGTYLCNWSGHLLRVPEDGVKPGRSPVLEIVGREPLYATKLAQDPFITLTKARMIAANLDLPVGF